MISLSKVSATRLTEHSVRFSSADLEAANQAWRCTCGPVAIACVLNLTLDEVRPLLGSDYRGWMNPTQLRAAIERAGVHATERNRDLLYRPDGHRQFGFPIVATYGLTRIQFAGPWTQPGVHPKEAYRYTHWVASVSCGNEPASCPGVYDNNWEWMNMAEFLKNMSLLAHEIPRANGKWWPTHIYEIEFPS